MSIQNHLARSSGALRLNLLFFGLTVIFVGYFLVWLPGPGAGLRLIGVELGEWIKFLGVGPRRDLFYFPPVVIGLALALLAAMWPNRRPQTWVARLIAVAVALLSFPAIAAIQLEPQSEWLLRLFWIGLVALVAGIGAIVSNRAPHSRWLWLLIAVIASLGVVLPTVEYLAVRPIVEEIMRRPIGIGLGVWLNAAGCLLVAAVAIAEFLAARQLT